MRVIYPSPSRIHRPVGIPRPARESSRRPITDELAPYCCTLQGSSVGPRRELPRVYAEVLVLTTVPWRDFGGGPVGLWRYQRAVGTLLAKTAT